MSKTRTELWLGAFTGFYRPDLAEVARLDVVSRFLYAARSVILVISAQAAMIAGLLAAQAGKFHLPEFLGLLVGLVVAHMISNLSNDYFGWKRGHDTPDSPRMRYTVHPLASGVLSPRALLLGLAILGALGLAIMAGFIVERGAMAAGFAAAGVALLFLYDAAPTPLKSIGLGEVATLIVWGPLMIGGGYAMITGEIDTGAMAASLPYGLGVMTILIGKHIDQASFDASRAIHTLPVLIGEPASRRLILASLTAMYAIVAVLVMARMLTPFAAAVVIALPRFGSAVRTLRAPRPAQPPPGYVGWPLWFHRACLLHNRKFGWAYIGGLAFGALFALTTR